MTSKLKSVFSISFLFFTVIVSAQKQTDIVIGKQFNISSKILKSERQIQLYLPDSYYDNNYIQYPVVYVLDGNKFFQSFSGVVEQLSSDVSPQIPESILVGISSQDRVRNSSPTKSSIGYSGKFENGYENSGGADEFIQFIQSELIPYIDANYRTNKYRTFVGYSFTGLPILHALFTKPALFNAYLVMDFSAWWDEEVTSKNMKAFFKTYAGNRKDVFITTLDIVNNDVYTQKDNKTWDFVQEFEQNHPDSIDFGYKKYGYKEESHHTLPLLSFIDGMKYFYRGYMLHFDNAFSYPERIKKQFNNLSKRLGYNIYPKEDAINYLGYQFLRTHKDLDKALFYFTYNTENYPQSSNVWSSLAEFYEIKGDKTKAIELYEKSLKLDPKNEELIKILKRLK